jgi:hypothetical protein
VSYTGGRSVTDTHFAVVTGIDPTSEHRAHFAHVESQWGHQ